MSRRTRRLLVFMGLAVIAISLLLLAYAVWPLGADVSRFPLPAELFAPPDAALLRGGVL
jgi:Na+-transporting methylmalonyl-CoA/oxaloacetate decarboxylase gamma subunit